MKPEVLQHWKKALRSYEEAKVAYGNRESMDEVKNKLFDAVLFGYGAVVEYRKKSDETHCVFGDWHATEHLWAPSVDSREAIEETRKTLEKYRGQIPEFVEPPKPID